MKNQHLPEKIQGTRLYLKVPEPAHALTMFDCICRDRQRLLRVLPWPAYINKVEDQLDFIKNSRTEFNEFQTTAYGLFMNDDDAFMGTLTSFAIDWENESFEIGYWLLSEYEGKGYMREAVSLLLQEHAKLGFHRAVIRCESENVRSKGIPIRLGFEYEGKLRDCKKFADGFRSLEVYSKLLMRDSDNSVGSQNDQKTSQIGSEKKNDIIIQQFTNAYFESSIDLFLKVFTGPPWNDKWPSHIAVRDYLTDYTHTPGFTGLIAREGTRQTALLFGHRTKWWTGVQFYIDEFCVDTDCQRSGIGTKMLDELKQILTIEGTSGITLLTAREGPAASFYEKNGFLFSQRMGFMSLRLAQNIE